MLIKNATDVPILLCIGSAIEPEPNETRTLMPKEEINIDIEQYKPFTRRIVINIGEPGTWKTEELKNKVYQDNNIRVFPVTTNPQDITKEEFDKVVNYVRDAMWTK